MCRARLGLKARAWARLWGLGLDEMESPALGEGSGPARLGLGLSPGLWTMEYLRMGDANWDVAICIVKTVRNTYGTNSWCTNIII